MAKNDLKTTKRPAKPFKGNEGKKFDSVNQPTPEAKKAGWQEWRKERHLTQEILKKLVGKDGQPTEDFKSYIDSLFLNAKLGNPKAMETINKSIEDDILKVAQTDSEGNDIKLSIDL